MPRPSLVDRARLYLTRMPDLRRADDDPQDSHTVLYGAALILMQGFDLPFGDATSLLAEYARRSDQPWSAAELEHKINGANAAQGMSYKGQMRPRGFMREGNDDNVGTAPIAAGDAPVRKEKPKLDTSRLESFAGAWAKVVDLVWLANRSYIEPSLINSGSFLRHVFNEGEYGLIFTDQRSQGEALWPDDELPASGKDGVWFLCQPVDGKYHPNPRTKTMSRRSEESVTSWRYLVLESDEAPARLWLGALAQLPLRIQAIYTSGGRSVHALVRVDAATKAQWDDEKHKMKEGLIILGADPGAMSAVRLTRLPGCRRDSKKQMQKLLYLNHKPTLTPICDMLARRNVEDDWLRLASAGVSETDTTGGGWLKKGLGYYANVSPRLKAALLALESGAEVSA